MTCLQRWYLLLGFLLLPITLQAALKIPFEKYLDEELETLGRAMEMADSETSHTSEKWFLRRTLLRVRPRIGIDVEFGKLQIMPEVEIVWQRDLPEGWELYKPKKP